MEMITAQSDPPPIHRVEVAEIVDLAFAGDHVNFAVRARQRPIVADLATSPATRRFSPRG
jgi:hypothetical protein